MSATQRLGHIPTRTSFEGAQITRLVAEPFASGAPFLVAPPGRKTLSHRFSAARFGTVGWWMMRPYKHHWSPKATICGVSAAGGCRLWSLPDGGGTAGERNRAPGASRRGTDVARMIGGRRGLVRAPEIMRLPRCLRRRQRKNETRSGGSHDWSR